MVYYDTQYDGSMDDYDKDWDQVEDEDENDEENADYYEGLERQKREDITQLHRHAFITCNPPPPPPSQVSL